MSKQWENEIAKRIHRDGPTDLRAYRCGYSGNNAMPQPDVLLTTPTRNYALELKGPIQSERVYIDNEDLEQLEECIVPGTDGFLVIKFPNRGPCVVRLWTKANVDGWEDLTAAERTAKVVPEAFNPRVTDSGKLAMDKPELDEWVSAREDIAAHLAILRDMGIIDTLSE